MIAEIVLGTFAAGAVLYQAQEAWGRAYERRTMRLRRTSESFYAAAHSMLHNPALDERHFRMVKIASEHVVAGDRASLHYHALRRAAQFAAKADAVKGSRAVPVALRSDLKRFTRAMVEAVAERQPLWKLPLLWTYDRAVRREKRTPEQAISALENALDDCLAGTA